MELSDTTFDLWKSIILTHFSLSGELSNCSVPIVYNATLYPNRSTYEDGTTVTVSCDEGFTLSGTSEVTCNSTSFGDLPTCEL